MITETIDVKDFANFCAEQGDRDFYFVSNTDCAVAQYVMARHPWAKAVSCGTTDCSVYLVGAPYFGADPDVMYRIPEEIQGALFEVGRYPEHRFKALANRLLVAA